DGRHELGGGRAWQVNSHRAMRRIAFLSLAIVGAAFAGPPDLILHHAKVVTVDGQFSIQPAIAIEGAKIAAVGDDASVLNLAGPRTEIVDLGGKMLMPGLMDSHVHPTGAAMT